MLSYFKNLLLAMLSRRNTNIVKKYKLIVEDGRIRTLNKKGWVHNNVDEINSAFLNDTHKGNKVLEIGAGFGYVTHKALNKGAEVYSNDIDARHLAIIKETAPTGKKDKLHLIRKSFPSAMNIAANSLDAILAQRVLHFLSGPQLEKGAKIIYKLLKPGGKVYITVATPYNKLWIKFIPVYEKAKAQGHKFPGYTTTPAKYNKVRAKNVKTPMHFLDMDVVTGVFKGAGFKIEKIFYYDNSSFSDEVRLDGREIIGLIAVKP